VKLFRQQGGQDLLEYALALPVFLLLVLGIAEFAIVIWSYDTVASAAREGVRSGIVYPYDLNGVETTVRARALGLDQDTLHVSAGQVDNMIRVTVTYSLTLMTGPVIEAVGGDSTIQLGTVATMRIE
jgi:Flp pilus assembly protein TadG